VQATAIADDSAFRRSRGKLDFMFSPSLDARNILWRETKHSQPMG
jgi:hypothetical protein